MSASHEPRENCLEIDFSHKYVQIKHGHCYLSACRHLCALINLCNFNRHKWECYRFCVTRWALEYWLIGYGWIIHLKHRIAVWLRRPCQWLSGGWRGECWKPFSVGRVKMMHALLANLSPSAEKTNQRILVLIQHFFCYHQTILHNKTFPPYSDIYWWIDLCCRNNIAVCHDDACFGRTDHR